MASLHVRLLPFANGNANGSHMMKMDQEPSPSLKDNNRRKENITTPDNFNFGDMPADYRKRYLQMLEQHNKKK